MESKERISDLTHIQRVFRFNTTRKRETLCLNSLRLDVPCLVYIAKELEAVPEHDRPSFFYWRKSLLVPSLSNGNPSKLPFKESLAQLMRTIRSSLRQCRILDRSDDDKLSEMKIVVLFESLSTANRMEHVSLVGLAMQETQDMENNENDSEMNQHNSLDCQMEKKVGPALHEMLLGMQGTLQSFTLERCVMGHSTVRYLSMTLPRLLNLKSVSIQECFLDVIDQDCLMDGLVRSSASKLVVRRCGLVLPTVTYLLEQKKNLSVLDLSNNHLVFSTNTGEHERDSIQLFASALAKSSSLIRLSLRNCYSLTDSAVMVIFLALQENQRLEELDLSACGFTTLAIWATLSSPVGNGLVHLHVPYDLRSPRTVAAIVSTLQTKNTSLCRISGKGRWRTPGCRIQQLLLRNQLVSVIQQKLPSICGRPRLWLSQIVQVLPKGFKSSLLLHASKLCKCCFESLAQVLWSAILIRRSKVP